MRFDELEGVRIDATPEHRGGIVVVVEVRSTSSQRLDCRSRQHHSQSQTEHTSRIAKKPLDGIGDLPHQQMKSKSV